MKLRGDLEVVKNNARLLSDLLTNFNPATDGRLESHEVIQVLIDVLFLSRNMQKGLVYILHANAAEALHASWRAGG